MNRLEIERYTLGSDREHGYLVWDPATLDSILIDIAAASELELRNIEGFIARHNMRSVQRVDTRQALAKGFVIRVGNLHFEVIELGEEGFEHFALYEADAKCMFVGDVVYNCHIDKEILNDTHKRDLLRDVLDRIFSLPDDVMLYPAHGEPLTVRRLRLIYHEHVENCMICKMLEIYG